MKNWKNRPRGMVRAIEFGCRPAALACLVLCGAFSAMGVESRVLSQDEGLALYDIIATEHDKALSQLTRMEFSYTRRIREKKKIEGSEFAVETTITGREQRYDDRRHYEVAYEHVFPEGNPRGYETSWKKYLMYNSDYLAVTVAGTMVAHAWENDKSEAFENALEHELAATRCPLLIKVYGDGNTTLSSFRKFVEAHDTWQIEVTEIRRDDQVNYEIKELHNEEGKLMCHKSLVISSAKGYSVESIRRYAPDGTLWRETRINAKPTDEGVWLPATYEVVEYEEDQADGETERGIRLRAHCEIQSLRVTTERDLEGLDFYTLGLEDGHRFVVGNTNENEMHILYERALVPKDVYAMFKQMKEPTSSTLE